VQELRLLYREPDPDRAEQRLLRWFTAVAEDEIPELVRLACTLDAWRGQLLVYFDTGCVSHGPTEAINGLIKKVKRAATATATSPITGSAYFCTAASTGTLPPPPRSEDGYHAWLRRADFVFPAGWVLGTLCAMTADVARRRTSMIFRIRRRNAGRRTARRAERR
jgi:Transposase